MDDVNDDFRFVGAEAEVESDNWLARPIVAKRRRPKAYRDRRLDDRIRRERTRTEAALLAKARRAGVPAPVVYDIDGANHTLRMQRIRGPTLRDVLRDRPDEAGRWLAEWGRHVGRLHAAGLVHGDLTSSNAIVADGRLVLVDFGLAERSGELEDHGVDLVLAQRTIQSTHPATADAWFRRFLDGYAETNADAESVVKRMHEIRGRARYV